LTADHHPAERVCADATPSLRERSPSALATSTLPAALGASWEAAQAGPPTRVAGCFEGCLRAAKQLCFTSRPSRRNRQPLTKGRRRTPALPTCASQPSLPRPRPLRRSLAQPFKPTSNGAEQFEITP